MAEPVKQSKMIAFRLSEKQLADKIDAFREEYGKGQHGMVTWARFCTFIGYSMEEVAECYTRGKESKNAYSTRAEMLERFQTECYAMTNETATKQQQLAKNETATNFLKPDQSNSATKTIIQVMIGCPGDDRWIEAMK